MRHLPPLAPRGDDVSTTPTPPVIDLGEIRRRLREDGSRDPWRSLEEVAGTDEFVRWLEAEYPRQAAGLQPGVERRDFLKLMSASLALAGVGGACTRQPEEHIVPYVKQPEGMILGVPAYYATAMPLDGFGVGLLAESHEGRPTKVEGNPAHPSSLGGTDAATQGSVLGLYDPDRSQVILSAGQIRTWNGFLAEMATVRQAQQQTGGAGFRILSGTVTSPTLAGQIEELLAAMPNARWHQWQPVTRDNAQRGAQAAFGTDVSTHYRLANAQVALFLDADVFGQGPARLRLSREWAQARRPAKGKAPMRTYAIESTLTTAGSVADHRLAVRAADVEALARALAGRLGVAARPIDTPVVKAHAAFLDTLAKDLAAHRGAAVVIPGDGQPPAVHALAHALNAALGAVGQTVVYTEPVEARPMNQLASLRALCADIDAGRVDCLVILGGNPVYTAPVDLDFATRLQKIPLRVHLSPYDDETSLLCQWHIPEAHYLESWSDVRADDGTVALIQPLIAPLYNGRTAHEVIGAFGDAPARSTYDAVKDHWKSVRGETDFETFWRQALHDGVVPHTAAPATAVGVGHWDTGALPAPAEGLELVFRNDPYVHDGAFSNNPWLRELPRPLTKLTWDNVALVAPATAEKLGLATENLVELSFEGRTITAPVWVQPGQAPDSIAIQLGFGRTRGGQVATGLGFNAYAVRTGDAIDFGAGLAVKKLKGKYVLACTQSHQRMEGRPLVRYASFDTWQRDPSFAQHAVHEPGPDMTMYPNYDYSRGNAWGMTIDLGSCTGCMACVAACVAENNIAVVGKEMVAWGREMHWLRIDRYFHGDLDQPEVLHQPVPCMHCENAPCEVVCPVNATVHSSEGLNDMVYNRCVGTRYCSNNCPYKVRRFNFFLFSDWTTESLKMGRNPDVTVRSRGVMEKCTYCVQRIEESRHAAIREDRAIRDGEIVTACQQACPSDAIVFGNINDPESRVAKLKADPRNYGILTDLNTRPRTTYLARVTNPNPALAPATDEGGGHGHGHAAPGAHS
ncbi:MAG: TAT-variant-translocated molybdopterin oxidoreductase [bacterium]|nr:TAT-variant-translocated molybdopterin oxidoreductase [bacterium]